MRAAGAWFLAVLLASGRVGFDGLVVKSVGFGEVLPAWRVREGRVEFALVIHEELLGTVQIDFISLNSLRLGYFGSFGLEFGLLFSGSRFCFGHAFLDEFAHSLVATLELLVLDLGKIVQDVLIGSFCFWVSFMVFLEEFLALFFMGVGGEEHG